MMENNISVSYKMAKEAEIVNEVVFEWRKNTEWESRETANIVLNQWKEGKLDLYISREKFAIMYPSQEYAMKKWPRIIAHMIAESLGYFTPRSAANALLSTRFKKPYFCEYYTHLAGGFDGNRVLKAGREQVRRSIQGRAHHTGYMASYKQARQVIAAELQGQGPMLASWFSIAMIIFSGIIGGLINA